ncbi:MAG: M23 family metallopeptidase, partial [Myxococcaceae bacterium]
MPFIAPRLRLIVRRLCLVLGLLLLRVSLAAGFLLYRRPYLLDAWRYRTPPSSLAIPVEGMAARSLRSTFLAPRDGGRRKHQGADLFAVRGTRVVSASHGVLVKVGTDSLGGNVVTVLGEGPAFYYYAHLDEWAPGLRPGDLVT